MTLFFWYATTCSVTDDDRRTRASRRRSWRWSRTCSIQVSDSFFGCVYQSPLKGRTTRAVLREVELLDLVGRAHVQVDRAGVDGRVGARPSRRCRSPRRRSASTIATESGDAERSAIRAAG